MSMSTWSYEVAEFHGEMGPKSFMNVVHVDADAVFAQITRWRFDQLVIGLAENKLTKLYRVLLASQVMVEKCLTCPVMAHCWTFHLVQ